MASRIGRAAHKAARTFELRDAANELGYSDRLGRAMTHVETVNAELANRGLTWDNVPNQFGTPDLFPATALGRLALRAAEAADSGFRLLEEIIEQPGAQRDAVLGAYERCLRLAPLPVETPEQ